MKAKFTSLILLTLCIAICHARDNENCLLWEIRQPKSKSVSYLFGTIHLLKKSDLTISPSLEKAYTNSNKLLLEIDLSNQGNMVSAGLKSMLPAGKTFEMACPDSLQKSIEHNMKSVVGISNSEWSMLKMIKPIFWTPFVLDKLIPNLSDGYDMYFMNRAQKNKQEIIGLETSDEAMASIDQISLSDQYNYFASFIKHRDSTIQEIDQLMTAYRNRDMQKIKTILESSLLDMESGKEALLEDRNKAWLKKIIPLIQEHECFIAVGAGHLPGNEGLIALLRKEGFIVTGIEE